MSEYDDQEQTSVPDGTVHPEPARTGADGPGEVEAPRVSEGLDEEAPQPQVSPLRQIIEAILLVVDQPVDETLLAQVAERPRSEVAAVLGELAREYDEPGRGFQLRNVAGGWRLYTHPDCAAYVERFVLDGQQTRLTQAALETLAVIAYRQPVTRARIAAVRGVNVDGVVRTLLARGLVSEVGSDTETGGTLYETTPLFLEKLGLASLQELPPLAEHLPDIATLETDEGEGSR